MIKLVLAFIAGGCISVVLFAALVASGGSTYLRRRESARLRVLGAAADLTVLGRDNAFMIETANEVERLAHELAVAAEELT